MMARPKPSFPDPAAILALANVDGLLEDRAAPNASADAVVLPTPDSSDRLVVRTTASPEHGKANEAILRLFARALDRPGSDLRLVRGASHRDKLVRIGATRS